MQKSKSHIKIQNFFFLIFDLSFCIRHTDGGQVWIFNV